MLDFKAYARMFRSNMITVLINILGLGVGLAASLTFFFYLHYELNFDTFWVDGDTIWRIDTVETIPGRDPIFVSGAPASAGALMLDNFPDFTDLTRAIPNNLVIKVNSDVFEEMILFADDNFMEFFNFSVIGGSVSDAIVDNNSIALSRRLALKYFGTTDIIGNTLRVLTPQEVLYRVSAVFDEVPKNSHFKFDAIARLHRNVTPIMAGVMDNWANPSFKTYIKMPRSVAAADIEAQFPAFLVKYFPADFAAALKIRADELLKLTMIPLDQIHLYGADLLPMKPRANIVQFQIFALISLLVLIISSFNFINLNTAIALKKAREIALRKTLGANRAQLIAYFFRDAFLTTVVAFLVALVLLEFSLPALSALTGSTATINPYNDARIWGYILILLFSITAVTAFYPAIKMSGVRPADVLRSNKSTVTGTRLVQEGLTLIQFTLSIGLLVAAFTISSQLRFIQSFDHGFKADDMLVVRGIPDGQGGDRSVFIERLEALAGVRSVGRAAFAPLDPSETNVSIKPENSDEPLILGLREVGRGFFNTYSVLPIAGRLFSDDFEDALVENSDGRASQNILLNVKAARKLGYVDPSQAVGTVLKRSGAAGAEMTVVGVIDDIFFNSLHREIRDEIYVYDPEIRVISVSYDRAMQVAVTEGINQLWRMSGSDQPLRMEYLENIAAGVYADDRNNSYLIGVLTALGVALSMLGLYSMAVFTIERHDKEVALRKVHGARIRDIILLMLWRMLKPILFANILAWPVAYYFLTGWLSGFVHRIDLGVSYFMIAGSLGLLLAALAIFKQAVSAARTHPAEVLKQS